jgi:hypothetical protein
VYTYIGAIVGIAVGGFIFLTFIALAITFMCRRKTQERESSQSREVSPDIPIAGERTPTDWGVEGERVPSPPREVPVLNFPPPDTSVDGERFPPDTSVDKIFLNI